MTATSISIGVKVLGRSLGKKRVDSYISWVLKFSLVDPSLPNFSHPNHIYQDRKSRWVGQIALLYLSITTDQETDDGRSLENFDNPH